MEPDPTPESSNIIHSNDSQITNKDINTILGISKKGERKPHLYLFSKIVIITTAVITTLVYFSFYFDLL